jgi:adhesin/invasin
MRIHTLFLAAAIGLAAACSDSSTTEPTNTGTGTATANGITISTDTTVKLDNLPVGSTIVASAHILQNGAPVANAVVAWLVTGGGGTVAAASSLTDATGLATVNWTLSDTVRTNTLSAGITGAAVVITANTIAAAPSSVVKISPDSSAVVAGSLQALTARAVDRFGNGVAGVTVNWTSSGGGSLSAASTVTGSNGNATENFTTGTTPGTYLITASVPGQASVTFKVVGL